MNKRTNRSLLKKKVPITRPVFDDNEKATISKVLDSGRVVQGSRVAEFEKRFAEFVGSKYAIAVSSCTAALHLSLLAAGVRAGDEVIIPSFTFVATANAVEYIGARPVFIDIDLSTFNICIHRLKRYLEIRLKKNEGVPRFIVPVSLFGLCVEMDQINALADKYSMTTIEDAACGLGAMRYNFHAGTEALAGCFSFHPRKVITTGEGGMVITDDERINAQIRQLRDHGASKTDLERHLNQGGSLLPEYNVLGYNYRMTDLQGAMGVAQMGKLKDILRARYDGAKRYNDLLLDIPEIRIPTELENFHHAYQSYVCLLLPQDFTFKEGKIDWELIEKLNQKRNRLMAHLEDNGISVRQGTHAVHTLGYYQRKYGFKDTDFTMSYMADRLSLTLPLFAGLSNDMQGFVVDCLVNALSII